MTDRWTGSPIFEGIVLSWRWHWSIRMNAGICGNRKFTMNEDLFLTQHGDFPDSHVSLPEVSLWQIRRGISVHTTVLLVRCIYIYIQTYYNSYIFHILSIIYSHAYDFYSFCHSQNCHTGQHTKMMLGSFGRLPQVHSQRPAMLQKCEAQKGQVFWWNVRLTEAFSEGKTLARRMWIDEFLKKRPLSIYW